ncbi:MAG: hypothetical protein KBC91_04090 [Candidatus Omnitrophica bacterium]|nr:hypothetical protein [Candidatus Omnitrophota bacterium]
MKPEGNRERDSDNNITQLLQLIRKIIGSQFKNGAGAPDIFSLPQKNQGINLNLCLFSFFPMTPDELDELEAMYEDLEGPEDEPAGDLSSELTSSDVDFLRRHGIKF